MVTLLFGLALGVVIAVVGPGLMPQQLRGALLDSALRVIGLAAVVLSIASTSFVHVPDGRLGQLFRVYGGGPLTEGRILAVRGENGPQARILSPASTSGCWSTSSTRSIPATRRSPSPRAGWAC
jgi:hypothetical protein